jgi:hypothetical protein
MSKNGRFEPTRTLGTARAKAVFAQAWLAMAPLLLRLAERGRRDHIGMSWPVCLPAHAACFARSRLPRGWLSRASQSSYTHAVFAPLCSQGCISLLPSRLTPTRTPTPPRLYTLYIARLRNTRGSCDQLTPLGGRAIRQIIGSRPGRTTLFAITCPLTSAPPCHRIAHASFQL